MRHFCIGWLGQLTNRIYLYFLEQTMKLTAMFSLLTLFSSITFAKGLNKQLLDAVLDGDVQTAQSLIAQGADVNYTVAGNESLLICAAERGNPQVTKLLIEHGAHLDHRAKNGETALVRASSKGRFLVVQDLLKRGADTRAKAAEGGTALHYAVKRRDFSMMRMLVASGASLDLQDHLGRSVLHLAATFPKPEFIEFLLVAGSDPNGQDLEGRTPLMYAVRANNIHNSRRLLQYGANPAITDAHGKAPIDWAAAWNQDLLDMLAHPGTARMKDIAVPPAIDLKAVQQLIASGESLDQADQQGATPIFHAIECGDLEALTLLVTNGAGVNHANADGVTPLMLAAVHGRSFMAGLLLNHGAETELLSNNGYTALYLAGIRKDETIANMLLGSGAAWIGKYYGKPIWLWRSRRTYQYLLEEIQWLPNLTRIDHDSKYPKGIPVDPDPQGVVDISYPNLVKPVVTHCPPPIYPEFERNSKAHGDVLLEAVITETGKVRDVKLLLGLNPFGRPFDRAAIKAVKTWRFKPGTLNGEPREVRMPLVVHFDKIQGARGNF